MTTDNNVDVTKEIMYILFDLSRSAYLAELENLRNKYKPILESELLAIKTA